MRAQVIYSHTSIRNNTELNKCLHGNYRIRYTVENKTFFLTLLEENWSAGTLLFVMAVVEEIRTVGDVIPVTKRSRLKERCKASSIISMARCPPRGPISTSLSTLTATGVHEGEGVGQRDTPALHVTALRTLSTRTDLYTTILSQSHVELLQRVGSE